MLTVAGIFLQRPCFAEQLRWLLLDFRGSKYFFHLSLVFIANSHTGSCFELLWKEQVKRQKQPLKLPCKKGVFRSFASSTRKQLCWSLFLIELKTFRPAALLKGDSNTCIAVEFTKFLRTLNLKSANACLWNLFFHPQQTFVGLEDVFNTSSA